MVGYPQEVFYRKNCEETFRITTDNKYIICNLFNDNVNGSS